MTFPMSLVLYNPLEAFMMILILWSLSKSNFNKSILDFRPCSGFKKPSLQKYNFILYFCYVYGLSTINLILQYVPNIPSIASDTNIQFLFIILSSFLICPIVMHAYTRKTYRVNIMVCLFICMSFVITSVLIASTINSILGDVVWGYSSMLFNTNELIINVSIRVIQFLILIFIRAFGKK